MVRYSAEHKDRTRARILKVSGRAFRERGFDGVGVADVMKGAGLTHGGFYAHFRSKEDLIGASLVDIFRSTRGEIEERATNSPPGEALSTVIRGYLTRAHRDEPGFGCAVAALGSELPRLPLDVRTALSKEIEGWLDSYTRYSGGDRQMALLAASAVVGAMQMARSVTDPALSDEILDSVATTLVQLLTPPRSEPLSGIRSKDG